MPDSARRSLALAVLVLLALLGAADGVYLTQVHLDYLFDPESMRGSVCHALSSTGCTVTVGSYGSIRGVPVSIIGFAGCLTLAVLAAAAWRRRRLVHDPLRGVLLVLSTLAVVASLVMAGLSWVEGAFCPFCVAWYGLNAAMLVSAYVARDRSNLWQDNFDEALGSNGFLAMAIFAAALLAGLWVYHDRRDTMQAEAERELLDHADEIAADELEKAKARGVTVLDVPNAPMHGPESAQVEIIEFSDFECPFCRKLWESTEAVLETSAVPVRVRFVHFPLNASCNPVVAETRHPNACAAAVASECAGRQQKFWEYGSVLFEHQDALGHDDLLRYAKQTGLQMEAFEQCLNDPAAKAAVAASARLGQTANVSGTPTFFINGHRFVGSMPAPIVNALVKLIAEQPPHAAAPQPEPSPTQPPARDEASATGGDASPDASPAGPGEDTGDSPKPSMPPPRMPH